MKALTTIALRAEPDFDFPTFLFLAQSDQIGPHEMRAVLDTWDSWRQHLRVIQLGERKGYLLIYLEEPIERAIEALWAQSPSEAFKHEAIAQTMIMGTLKSLVPEIGEKQCAPVPEPSKPLSRTLRGLGLDLQNSGALSRKYATITPYPYRYGCERCFLKDTCVKNMNLDFSTP